MISDLINFQTAIHDIKKTINETNSVDHDWLVKKSDKRPKQTCSNSLESIEKSKSALINISDSKKLLNFALLYIMVDSRYLLPENVLKEVMEKQSLLELIMLNWVDLNALKMIIQNVIGIRKPDFGGFFGKFRMTNIMFLNLLKNKYPPDLLMSLGISSIPDSTLLKELEVMGTLFSSKNDVSSKNSIFKGGYFAQGDQLNGIEFNASNKNNDIEMFKNQGGKIDIGFKSNSKVLENFLSRGPNIAKISSAHQGTGFKSTLGQTYNQSTQTGRSTHHKIHHHQQHNLLNSGNQRNEFRYSKRSISDSGQITNGVQSGLLNSANQNSGSSYSKRSISGSGQMTNEVQSSSHLNKRSSISGNSAARASSSKRFITLKSK